MIHYDLERARKAVQFLVDSSYFAHHVTKLRTSVARPRSMPFKDKSEVLNELLVVGRQSVQAMENLIEVAEVKRGDRNEYQKNYMATKRRRERKIIEHAELMAGAKLPLSERVKVVRDQFARWHREKDATLAALPEGTSWLQKNEATRLFWEAKDEELDVLIARAQERGPVRRRRVVSVAPPPPKTEFGKSLRAALQRK